MTIDVTIHPSIDQRVLAYATLVFGGLLVVHEVKVIRLEKSGKVVVAMPNKKLSARCGHCNEKNHLLARYCNTCGARLPPRPPGEKWYADITHPINPKARQMVDDAVLSAYYASLQPQVPA